MKRVAIYIRVSSDEAKKEGYSPQTQEEKLREFIKSNGFELNEKNVYKDLGYSGGTDARPELQRLLRDARNKEFDILLVYRLDRFFRNLRLLLNTLEELKRLGIDFKSITESFDTSTLSGEVTLTALGMAADLVRKITLEARNEGMIKAMKEGKWLGGTPPYGYKFNPQTQKLEIDEEEAKIVRMMYEWVVFEKLSKYKVQTRLNEMKVLTKHDKLKRIKKKNGVGWWNSRTVERILENEIYTGEFYYRKYKFPNGMRKELRPREEWIKIETPAIISKELFERAQRQFEENKKLSPRRTGRLYALQKKIYCGIDGFIYHCFYRVPRNTGQKGSKVYLCGGKVKHGHQKLCPSKYVTENRILPAVWNNLKSLLTNPAKIMENLQEYRDRDSKKKIFEEELERVNKSLTSCQRKREKILNLYLEDLIDEKTYKEKLEKFKKEEMVYQREGERLSQLLLSEEERKMREMSIKELYDILRDNIENATYEIKCQIIKRLVEKITIVGNSLEIVYNLPLKMAFQEVKKPIPASDFFENFCTTKRRMD